MEKVNVSEIIDKSATAERFVEYNYRKKDAFKRLEVLEAAHKEIRNVIAETGGDMPRKTADLYEELNVLMQEIKNCEYDVVRVGI